MQINKHFPAKILVAAEGHGVAGRVAQRVASAIRYLIGSGTSEHHDVGICGGKGIAYTVAKFPK